MQHLFDFDKDMHVPKIEGMDYIRDFISEEEEEHLISKLDAVAWDSSLKRRVQHYGYRYDYVSRRIEPDAYLGQLPMFLSAIARRLQERTLLQQIPDQCIVNEYLAGQGISDHIDCIPCFDDVIAGLTLGSGATMQFKSEGQKEQIYLQPRSLIILSGSARYKWTHGIPARKSDIVHGVKRHRERRISLTFRNVIIGTRPASG